MEHLHHNSRARVVPEISRAHNAAVHSRSTEGNQEPEGLPARTTWPCGSAGSTCFASKQVKSHKCRIWCRIHGTARCNEVNSDIRSGTATTCALRPQNAWTTPWLQHLFLLSSSAPHGPNQTIVRLRGFCVECRILLLHVWWPHKGIQANRLIHSSVSLAAQMRSSSSIATAIGIRARRRITPGLWDRETNR